MDYLEKLRSEFENYRTGHKHLPTDSQPHELKRTLFYSEYLVYKNQKIDYNDIHAISTKYQKKTTNEIFIDINITFRIYYDNFESSEGSYIDLSYKSEILGWRKREITLILMNFIKNKTFKKRLENYLFEVKSKGYFNYHTGKIFNNGDIFSKDKFIANLYEENKKGNVWFGVAFSSLLGRNKLSDPYLIRIKNAQKDAKLFQKKDFDFDTEYNKDVFDVLITEIIEKGSIMKL